MIKMLKQVSDILITLLVGVAAVLAFLLVGMRFLGFEIFTVLSGSMEPTYHTGSIIYVKDVEHDRLKAGDVITYNISGNVVATHRIVELVPDENNPGVIRYRTKGDANEAVDGSLVDYNDVIGSPVFSIPNLGYVAHFVQNPPGMYIVFSGTAFVLLLSALASLLSKEEKEAV